MNFDSLPNNVYYDANIINNDQSGTKAPPRLVFKDIRSTSILTYPELYELSVVRNREIKIGNKKYSCIH